MTRPRDARWPGPLALLGEVRHSPGVTRAEAARRLGLGSGSATDITARLRALDLLDEVPAPAVGRGRPTTRLVPHPRGPLVAIVEVRYEGWRLALSGIDGRPAGVAAGRRAHGDEEQVVQDIAGALRDLKQRHGHRLRAVSVSVAAAVRHRQLVRPTTLGWDPTDLSGILPDASTPLVIGNDATLAGLAEARGGAGRGAGTVLHLAVEVGLGGVLVIDGVPAVGGSGAGGEYGHMPFGDRSRRCPCGARGCWDDEVDGRALARHLGIAQPEDPRAFAQEVLKRAADDTANDADAAAADAVRKVADALATGIAGLVNAHDPDVVTLGGLAPLIRAAAQPDFDAAYLDGLMEFRRADPIPLRAASLGADGTLIGAAAAGLDLVLSESGLDDWAADLEGRPPSTGGR